MDFWIRLPGWLHRADHEPIIGDSLGILFPPWEFGGHPLAALSDRILAIHLEKTVTAIASFLDNLEKSHLLSTDDLAEVRDATGSDAKPEAVAKQLVKLGLLSRWQAKRLLAGNHTFFVGKYQLLKRLGRGDSASVFKADQPGMKRPVAIKVLPKELTSNKEAMERFRREVRVMASLEHENIARVYDAGQIGDVPYMVMEYVGGRDLTAWIEKYAKLPVPWACEVARQVASGLQYVHDNGLVHRDINPSNILVRPDEELIPHAKILDFGRVKSLAESGEKRLTVQGQSLGTPDYIAPEQARNAREADIRSDIYSLGSTLFHMLTGQVPYHDDDPMKKMTAFATKDAPKASTLREDIPRALDTIVAKMLARDPDARYQEPEEVALALSPFSLGSEDLYGVDEVEEETVYEGIAYEEEEEEPTAAQFDFDRPSEPEEEDPNVYEFLARLADQAD